MANRLAIHGSSTAQRDDDYMRYTCAIIFILFMNIMLFSCSRANDAMIDSLSDPHVDNTSASSGQNSNDSSYSDSTTAMPQNERLVTISGVNFTIEEIKAGIKDTINCRLYLHGHDEESKYFLSNRNLVLHQDIEYDLFYDPSFSNGDAQNYYSDKIFFIITNMLHPLSTDERHILYAFGIDITDRGLRSKFHYQFRLEENEPFPRYGKELIYLGHHTLLINEVVAPPFENMSDEWIESTKEEIRRYMDEYDLSINDTEEDLESGNYRVYVQRFFRSDEHSIIIFEHENGNVYIGIYYFVHENTGTHPADLNSVGLHESFNSIAFRIYMEMVRLDPAVSLEYSVMQRN